MARPPTRGNVMPSNNLRADAVNADQEVQRRADQADQEVQRSSPPTREAQGRPGLRPREAGAPTDRELWSEIRRRVLAGAISLTSGRFLGRGRRGESPNRLRGRDCYPPLPARPPWGVDAC